MPMAADSMPIKARFVATFIDYISVHRDLVGHAPEGLRGHADLISRYVQGVTACPQRLSPLKDLLGPPTDRVSPLADLVSVPTDRLSALPDHVGVHSGNLGKIRPHAYKVMLNPKHLVTSDLLWLTKGCEPLHIALYN